MRKERKNDQLRDVKITTDYIKHPQGSCLIEMGQTKVICSASFDESVPPFLEGKDAGWVTAEYSMLPGATHTRSRRESATGRISGRTHEIQRLIGRALRSTIDMKKLGPNSMLIDCDVIQADGGTRTAAITGGWVALNLAVKSLIGKGKLTQDPICNQVAAISIGMYEGEPMLDLDYSEDYRTDMDMNLVMNLDGQFIEIQGTSEHTPAGRRDIDAMIDVGWEGIQELFKIQNAALK